MLTPSPSQQAPDRPVLRARQRIAAITTTALLALLLSACTYDMYNALLGHANEPLDTEEAMARDSREILDLFEKKCFSERAVWRRTGTLQAECSHSFTSQWGLMDANKKWFEALTRGVNTFDSTIKARYPSVLIHAHASGGNHEQHWGQSRYWHWRYLLGDGSNTLKADRNWDRTWNMTETAYSAENVKMTLSLNIQNECLREHPLQNQLIACPAMREGLYAGPFSPDSLDRARITSNENSIRADLASIESGRLSSAQAQAALRARQAQEQRDSQLAIERGLQQGIGNVMANTTIKPPIPLPRVANNTATSQTQNVPSTRQTPAPTPNALMSQQKQAPHQASLANATTGNPSQHKQAKEPRWADFQEAVVFCWANQSNQPPAQPQDERWICHGPTQLIQVNETLAKAIAQAGCENALQQGRRWPFDKGTLYGCGFGRETYDENVAARYGVPSGILNQLQTYRCSIPYSQRCSTPK